MSISLCYRKFSFLIKTRLIIQPSRSGYIVLLPELPNNVHTANTTLMKDNMPDFTSLTTEKCITTMGKHLLDFEQGIRIIEQSIEKAGCTNVVKEIFEPIEALSVPNETAWGIVKNLYLTNSKLMPASAYIPLHNRARRARSAKFYSKSIYFACKDCDHSNLTEEDQRVLDKYLLEGRLAGLELEEDQRKQLANIHIQMAECKSSFEKRVKISSEAFRTIIHDPNTTRDMPDYLLRLIAENKDEPSRGPWSVRLDPQVTPLILAHCPDRDLRWNVWQASTRVASQSLEDSELHNSVTLQKIRALRRDEARLLGYESYAHMSMETKMAGSLENVRQTLGSLLDIAKPAADREIVNLQQFAWERGFEGTLQVWDIPYWQRKQVRALYNYQEEVLNDFFPLEKVWSGLLNLSTRLFNIEFEEAKDVNRWHPDVRFFYLKEDGRRVAGLYVDTYNREDKVSSGTGNAWLVNILPATRKAHKTLPLSTLVLHIDPPIYGKPALLSWHQVNVLFRQFGHMLQQLLTTVTYSEVAGTSNIEWDAVEIVPNVFSHWLRNPEVLESISGHYATNEKLTALPIADIEKHFAGYRLCEELFKAHLDLDMYSTKDFWQDIMKRLWPAHFMLPHDRWDSTPCSFSAVVTEEWCAAYYSHLWARMVAADVYSAFQEEEDDKSVGARFRSTFLEFGGSVHPQEVFRRFRGRDPSPELFLKHLGLD